MKLIRSQNGSMLVYIIAIGAVVAFAAVMLTNMVKTVEDNFSSAKNRTRYEDLTNLLRKHFENAQTCSMALNGKSIGSSFSGAGTSLLPLSMDIGNKAGPVAAGFETPFGLKISEILIKTNPTVIRGNIQRDIPVAPVMRAADAEILVYTDRGTPGLALPKHQFFKIEVMLNYEGAGASSRIVSCFSRVGDGALCTRSGGAYNAFALGANRARCEPDEACFLSKRGIISNPALCVAPYVATRIAASLYYCQWCNQNP